MGVKPCRLFGDRNTGQTAYQCTNGQQRGNALCNQGCPAYTGNAHIQFADKQYIQNHIKGRGECQKIQWGTAVTQTVKNSGSGIIQEQEQQSGNINPQINHGGLKNIFRCADEPHQGWAKQLTACCQHQCQCHQCDDCRIDCSAHAYLIVCAEQLGNDNRTAYTGTGSHSNKQNCDRICCAGSSQSLNTQVPSGNDTVSQIVHLLEYHTQQQRNHKFQQNFEWRPLGHVSHHVFLPHISYAK